VVVTGHTGPKAFRILEAAGAVVYQCAEPTVGAALNKWKHGELVKSIQADVEGHWV
jgi:predicted Fe-Mo cluster-binding NifX family protein